MHPATFTEASRTSAAPRVVVVIPARYQSSRFPGKALAGIAGRPMIEHVYRRSVSAAGVHDVIVATDDERIAEAVTRFGGSPIMTSSHHRTGTDRVAEVAATLDCDVVVNVQGDEPLIPPAMIEDVIAPLRDGGVVMATLRRRIENPEDLASPHVVKVVVDRDDNALYFSRLPIPFVRDGSIAAFKHIGLYAYRRSFLLAYSALPQTPLESVEALEQLRALEHGFRIRTPETSHDSLGVDTPEDLIRVERQLEELAASARK